MEPEALDTSTESMTGDESASPGIPPPKKFKSRSERAKMTVEFLEAFDSSDPGAFEEF